MHPLRRLFSFSRAYRRDIYLGSIYSALNKVFDVLPEILIGVAVDVVVNQRDSFLARMGIPDPMDQLWALVGLTVFVWLAESAFEYLYALKWRNLAQNLQHDLRLAAYAHVQRLPPDQISKQRSGRLMAVLNEDVNQIERFLNTGANDLIQVMLSSLLVGAVFFILTADLALLAILPVPLILFGAFWFQNRLAPRYAAAREAAATVSGRLDNNLHGMATIQAYTAEAFEAEHVKEASDNYRLKNADAIRFSAAITPVIRIAILFGFVATLLYGGWLTLNDQLGVGSYSALVYLTQRLLWPLTRLAEMTDLYNRAMASVNRVMGLLDTPAPPVAATTLRRPAKGHVCFENVRFEYPEQTALDGISFDLPAGKTVALVGATGGGKSTVLKLLLGFIRPTSGHILLDDQPLSELDPASVRRIIAYVSQDPFLTDASIAANIAYGDPKPDQQRIVEAAEAAEAIGFINALPRGFDSEVGERGTQLSGGQKQRIALARALYRQPKILLLDEATSAVDNETEAAIQRSLARETQNRSTLIVAHRLSTVRQADVIHVFDRGRIIESGRHEELLALEGVYAGLWRLQSGQALASV